MRLFPATSTMFVTIGSRLSAGPGLSFSREVNFREVRPIPETGMEGAAKRRKAVELGWIASLTRKETPAVFSLPCGSAHLPEHLRFHRRLQGDMSCADCRAERAYEVLSTSMNASCGMFTWPMAFMRILPSLCFSSSLRLREMSPP